MKRWIPIALVLLLLIIAFLSRPGTWNAPTEPPPDRPPAAGEEPGVVPPDVVPENGTADGSNGDPASGNGAGHADGVRPPPGQNEPGASGTAAPTAGTDENVQVPPAARRNPRDPPATGPRVGPRGNVPPFGPTGGWEKFPPEIPRGRATVTVRITDVEGRPIPGAEAWLGPPDIRGDSSVSYAHLRKLGKSDAKGVLTAKLLPAGAGTIAGNLFGLLNGPRGLDATSAVAVTLVDDRTVAVDLKLPLSLDSLGRVAGIVRSPGGDPLRNAAVMVGYHRARTGTDGRFEIAYVALGDHMLSITRSGYRPLGEKVRVEAGETAEVDVTMEFRESGSISLSGTVTGPAGEPVAQATVYVIAYGGGSAGTVRSAQTDEQGHYEMQSLPDRLRKAKVRIQASRKGYHAANEVFESGMRSGEVNLTLPVKLTKLSLTVLDATSNDPLTRCRFEATKAGEARPSRTFSSRSETGVYETWIEAGTYRFQVEAPDHEAHVAEVTVPEGGADLGYTARLVASGAESVEIALTVLVKSAITGDPIETAKVEVLSADGKEALSSLTNRRPGGVFTMPAPSGRRRLRVTAKDHEVWEEDVDLKPDELERKVEAKLTPR